MFMNNKVFLEGLFIELNQNDFTAKIIDSRDVNDNLVIPRFIKQRKEQFHITHISEKSFFLNESAKTISFPEDSAIKSIGKYAFLNSSIESIFIPRQIKRIECGVFDECHYLQKIIFSEDSELYSIGKNAFAHSSINQISIPRKVRIIEESAFESCCNLKVVKFSDDSDLKIIEKNAFRNASIESITIPCHVKKIEEGTFSFCNNLRIVNFSNNSELQSIENGAFKESSIESIYIPSSLTEFKDGWCQKTGQLKQITISPNNQNFSYLDDKYIIGKSDPQESTYDVLIFANRQIQEGIIPTFIREIKPYSFSNCINLLSVKFSENSKLQSIGRFAFSNTSIQSISIPFHVKAIEEGTFSLCYNLKTIDFIENSELYLIESNAFGFTSIKSISIPSNVRELHEGWCRDVLILNDIYISPMNKRYFFYDNKMIVGKTDLESDDYDVLLFARRNVKRIFIPSFIERIASNAFAECACLDTVEFSNDSKLNSIGENSFYNSSIEYISIPTASNQIDPYAFSSCPKLKAIEFLGDDFAESLSFSDCMSIALISFPNATSVSIAISYTYYVLTVFIRAKSDFFEKKKTFSDDSL